jgi:hypothetical protein
VTEREAESVLKSLVPKMSAVWPKVVENLSKNRSWDVIRCLVLGPPEKVVDKSAVPRGWRYADCYKEGKQVKVSGLKIIES